MSIPRTTGTHYDNHHREAELQDAAAHAHEAAGQHGQQDHLTGHERTRQAQEHTAPPNGGHGVTAFNHEDIAALAFEYWQARGGLEGSPDEDWSRAVKELRSRAAGR